MRIFLWAGELVCGFRTQKIDGAEETPPTRRIAIPFRGVRREPWQRSRNDTSIWRVKMRHAKLPIMPSGSGETAVLQVERANSR